MIAKLLFSIGLAGVTSQGVIETADPFLPLYADFESRGAIKVFRAEHFEVRGC